MSPTVVLLAHGSPDVRHHEAVEAQARRTASAHGADVRVAYLETDVPSPGELGATLTGEVIVVPMLLTPAYHARVDVPSAAGDLGAGGARVFVAPALAPDALLLTACAELLEARDLSAEQVVLVAGGSSDGSAAAGLASLVAGHGPPGWTSTTLADARVPEGRPVVVPFVLAEGVLHDRVAVWAAAAGLPCAGGGLLATSALDTLVSRRAGLVG